MGDSRLQRMFRLVRSFFFSSVNKEFLIFLFFLCVSGAFWLIMAMNESYEREIVVPVRLVNVPKNVVVTSDAQDSIRVVVRDKGYVLATYLYGEKVSALSIDYKTYAKGNGSGTVPSADLKKQLEQRLFGSSKVVSLKPEKYEFFYNYGLNKRVPVKLLGTVKPGDSYYIARTQFVPDSVTIYASEDMLDSIKTVYTEDVLLTDITDTIVRDISLRKLRGVKCVPSSVRVELYPDVLTEESIEVPITPVNVPEGKILRTFPSRVKVTFVTGASMFRTIRPESFGVTVDYRDVADHPSDKCTLYMRSVPHGVRNARPVVSEVDYLIEQQ